jgi:hypothetical protein
VELREGIWNGTSYDANLKLINVPVLKHHWGAGVTGTLKHSFGILSMADGSFGIRHYGDWGTQCGKMWSLVRTPDLNILDCIWVSHETLQGYPPETTRRTNTLLAGFDPVALDYYASKHVLLPLGGNKAQYHDPDSYFPLKNHYTNARDFINANGGIGGLMAQMGDENIEVIASPPYVSSICEGDFDMDRDLDELDQGDLASEFGRVDCNGDCIGDFKGDQDVDGSDLTTFGADYGRTDCP